MSESRDRGGCFANGLLGGRYCFGVERGARGAWKEGLRAMLKTVLDNPWVRALGVVLILAAIFVAGLLLKPVLVSLFLAFLVAYVFDPVVDAFERRKFSRIAAIACIGAAGLVLALSIPLYVIPQVIVQAEALMAAPAQEGAPQSTWGARVDAIVEKLPIEKLVVAMGWADPADKDVDARAVLAAHIGGYVRENASQLMRALVSAGQTGGATLAGVFSTVGRHTATVLSFLGNLALFAIVTAYLLKDFDRIVAGAKELTPPRYRERLFHLVAEMDAQVHSFLRGQALVCACLGLMYVIGLTFCGVPFSILIGILGGVASFVPYLGLILTIVPSVILTLLQYGVDGHVFGVLCTFAIAQMIEGTLLTPKIVGDKVGLNPVWVILSILVFGSWLGFLGLLLAVPSAAALKVLVLEAVAYYKRSPVFDTGDSSGSS